MLKIKKGSCQFNLANKYGHETMGASCIFFYKDGKLTMVVNGKRVDDFSLDLLFDMIKNGDVIKEEG